jgi:ABC-type nitrate/sulfonate/bicarbonate transport system substrate-binding protein
MNPTSGRWLRQLTCVLTVVLSGCVPKPPTTEVRVGTLPSPDYLPIAVMIEKGFAAREGIRIVEVPLSGGGAILDGVALGRADTGNPGTIPVILAAARSLVPDEVTVVAATSFHDPQHPGPGVLVGPEVGSWKYLEGKLLAVPSRESLNAAALIIRLQDEGVHGYELVEIPIANMGLAVSGGSVAAAVLNDPYLAQSLLRRDGRLLGYIIGGPPFERFQLSMVVFRTQLVRERPQLVQAYLRAYVRSIRWLNRHPAKAGQLLSHRLNLDDATAARSAPMLWRDPPHNDPQLLDELQQKLLELGWLREKIPLEKLYDESLLERVLAGGSRQAK